jgi:hypothetical protein
LIAKAGGAYSSRIHIDMDGLTELNILLNETGSGQKDNVQQLY